MTPSSVTDWAGRLFRGAAGNDDDDAGGAGDRSSSAAAAAAAPPQTQQDHQQQQEAAAGTAVPPWAAGRRQQQQQQHAGGGDDADSDAATAGSFAPSAFADAAARAAAAAAPFGFGGGSAAAAAPSSSFGFSAAADQARTFLGNVLPPGFGLADTDFDAAIRASLGVGQQQHEPHPNAPPPASRNALATLPYVTVTQPDLHDAMNRECIVCYDQILLNSRVVRLPCAHVFHPNCIVPWLQRNCTCPICRYELPTDDPNFERGRLERMRHRKPRFAKHELKRMSVQQLKSLLPSSRYDGDKKMPAKGSSNSSRHPHFCEKSDLISFLEKSNAVEIIEAPEPVRYSIRELEKMSISKLRRCMEDAGVFYNRSDVVEKTDMLHIFCNSGRLDVIVDDENEEDGDGNNSDDGDAHTDDDSDAARKVAASMDHSSASNVATPPRSSSYAHATARSTVSKGGLVVETLDDSDFSDEDGGESDGGSVASTSPARGDTRSDTAILMEENPDYVSPDNVTDRRLWGSRQPQTASEVDGEDSLPAESGTSSRGSRTNGSGESVAARSSSPEPNNNNTTDSIGTGLEEHHDEPDGGVDGSSQEVGANEIGETPHGGGQEAAHAAGRNNTGEGLSSGQSTAAAGEFTSSPSRSTYENHPKRLRSLSPQPPPGQSLADGDEIVDTCSTNGTMSTTEGEENDSEQSRDADEGSAETGGVAAQFATLSISQLRQVAHEWAVDISSCIERQEMVDRLASAAASSDISVLDGVTGTRGETPAGRASYSSTQQDAATSGRRSHAGSSFSSNGNDVSDDRALIYELGISELRAFAAVTDVDLSQCSSRDEMAETLFDATSNRPDVGRYLSSLVPLAGLSVSRLRSLARERNVCVAQCLEKEEIIRRLVAHGPTSNGISSNRL